MLSPGPTADELSLRALPATSGRTMRSFVLAALCAMFVLFNSTKARADVVLQLQGGSAVLAPWSGEAVSFPTTAGGGVLLKQGRFIARGFVTGGGMVTQQPGIVPMAQGGVAIGGVIVPNRFLLSGGAAANVLFTPEGPKLVPTAILVPAFPLTKKFVLATPIGLNEVGAIGGVQLIWNAKKL